MMIGQNKIIPDFGSISYYKQTQHWWIAKNFDKIGLGQVKNVGSLMDFCYKKKPENLEDFWWKWIKLFSNQKRFLKLLDTINKIRPEKSEQVNVNTLFIGLFYNTFLGYLAEVAVGKSFMEQGYKVYKSNKSFDKKYAIDFLIEKPNGGKLGIQVKSENSRHNNSTQFVERNQRKMMKFRDEHNINAIYAYYTHSYDAVNKSFKILGYSLEPIA